MLALLAGSILSPVGAGERMALGAGASAGADFQRAAGDRVFFSESSAALGARARAALTTQAAWLLAHPSLFVTVEGHADDGGGPRQNLELSQRRAQAVRRTLIELGVAGEKIGTVAFGNTRPIARCLEAMCTAQNRRSITVPAASVARAAPVGE